MKHHKYDPVKKKKKENSQKYDINHPAAEIIQATILLGKRFSRIYKSVFSQGINELLQYKLQICVLAGKSNKSYEYYNMTNFK